MFTGKRFITVLVLVALSVLATGLYAQSEFPAGDFWSLDAGVGMNGILAEGVSFQFIVDPKLWLSPVLMVGSRVGLNYSIEEDSAGSDLGDILTFEGQVYLRWNFLRLGKNPEKKTNIFVQGGLGLISAYRGTRNPFNEVQETRGSVLADAGLGVTIPITSRWHIEPQIHGGYPHIFGTSLTAGYKFPLPQKVFHKTHYVEVIKMMPPDEVAKLILITAVEFVLFGPDIGRYNIGIDNDAQQLNEMVLDYLAQTLKDNPEYRIRIEGHANPFTIDASEADELMALSAMRANVIAAQMRARGIANEQMVIIAFGGTKTIASEDNWDIRNRNRRVELIVFQLED